MEHFFQQLRDCELGAIVNRDLSRRIRAINGITSHKQIVRHDIKLSAKIVHNLDSRVGLWDEKKEQESPKEDEKKESKSSDQLAMEIEQAVSFIKTPFETYSSDFILMTNNSFNIFCRLLDFLRRIQC